MRKLLFILLATSLPATLFAQSTNWKFYRHELSFGIGASNFLGELGGANQIGTDGLKDLEFSLTRPTIAIGYRYKFSPSFAGKVNLAYARLKGDDETTTEEFRSNRNLHFRAPLVEFSGQFEWYPIKERAGHLYRFKGVRGQRATHFSPYLFGGIGGAWFNPRAQASDGNWYDLQPLGTEGQNVSGSGVDPYKRITLVLPTGIGLKYNVDQQLSFGLELGMRVTFTDYMDDVSTDYYDNIAISDASGIIAAELADPSLGDPAWTGPGQQRGDPTDNDAYMFAIFSVNWKLLQGRLQLPKF